MRKRQVKKMAKNAKTCMTPMRKARGKGSKRDCRRLKAWNRVGRQIKREEKRRYLAAKQWLEDINAYEPKNEEEKQGCAKMRQMAKRAIKKYEDRQQEIEKTRAIFAQLKKKIAVATDSWSQQLAPHLAKMQNWPSGLY